VFFRCLYLYFSQFDRRKVHFGLGTKSIEANSLYFTVFSIDGGEFLNFLGSVLSLKIVFTPRFFAKKKSFGPRSRYRKKLSAAAANHNAGNQKISLDMHK
jgi:hypothetical protein